MAELWNATLQIKYTYPKIFCPAQKSKLKREPPKMFESQKIFVFSLNSKVKNTDMKDEILDTQKLDGQDLLIWPKWNQKSDQKIHIIVGESLAKSKYSMTKITWK